MRLATGIIEKRRALDLALKCDRCGASARLLDQAALVGWVCCHKIVSNDAHIPPPVPDLPEGVAAVIPVNDELHVCGPCWALVELAVRTATLAVSN